MRALADRDPMRVGLVTLCVLALLAAGVSAAARLAPGAERYTAVLEHTGGLRVGEEVQVAGVGVGEVTGIELGEERVEVAFTLDGDLRLGARTSAEVKVATLLGTHYLQVSPAGDGELPDATIPLDRTRVPFNLQDVIDEVVPEVDAFDTATIERSLAQVAATMEAAGGELGPALDGVRRLSAVVVERSDDLGELLGATRDVSRRLVNSGTDLVALMRHADAILDTLRVRRQTIHALLRDLAELGTQLAAVVEETEADLAPTLRDLVVVTDLLEEHADDVRDTVRALAPSARYFANASGTGGWLDQYVPGATPDNLECILERSCG
ncbi:MCE family protein [Nocardioides marmotae]|uniref:MCE family protein n=1 Tax=Nocardioides marmotae TaxID=2663857 RepID=UPI0012B5BA9E|nr:MCE family protein [Nocardioides marmotae]MBC9731888.1 MCE family protein [Nocardioides marmotae]MTB83008.1 MCE family protein [Nocardioides marmotae]